MFIARSQARIRAARIAFLLLAAIPTAVVVGWAAYVRSDAHRAAVERTWQRATGLPLTVGRIDHPRPGVIRGHDCLLPATTERPAVSISAIEVESSADEDRFRLESLACDPAAASALAALARAWLMDPLRFDRTCIIDVNDFHWADEPTTPDSAGLRIECVARVDSRAIRLVRRGDGNDEVRIVRHLSSPTPDDRLEIDATCRTPVPLAVLAAAGGVLADGRAASLAAARVSGELHAVREAGRWRGTAEGRIADVDLSAVAASVGGRAMGQATVDVTRLAWNDNRLSDGLFECATGSGWVESRLFDRIVLATGARPGPAAATEAQAREFDMAACIATVGPAGVQFLPASRLPTALAVRDTAVVLAAPTAPVPGDRLAWMLTAPGTAFGPAAGPGAWLMSVLPPLAPPESGSGRQF